MDTDLRPTRELWLEQAIDIFRERFIEVGFPLPDRIHVSVGFGYGAKRENAQVEGQCWAREASADLIPHIFISPEIGDTADVLRVLGHELVHAALNNEDGHKKRFAEIATRLGYESPMTAAAPSIELMAEFITLAETLGAYPHGALTVRVPTKTPAGQLVPSGGVQRYHSGPAIQRNRHIKVICPCCGYTVRTTARWLEVGLPSCPAGTVMECAD